MLYGPLAYVYNRWTLHHLRKDFAPGAAVLTSTGAKNASALGSHMHDHEDRVYS